MLALRPRSFLNSFNGYDVTVNILPRFTHKYLDLPGLSVICQHSEALITAVIQKAPLIYLLFMALYSDLEKKN